MITGWKVGTVLQTVTFLHTAFYKKSKGQIQEKASKFCKAHSIHGIYKDFYILYSYFSELIFIMDKKLDKQLLLQVKVAKTKANHDLLIWNCDTIKDC